MLAKPLDQSALVVGTAAMQYYNSNQLEAVSAAAGQQLKMLRVPSLAGKATERKAWYKASMLWSASAKTKEPRRGNRLDQLVCELPGGRKHRSG